MGLYKIYTHLISFFIMQLITRKNKKGESLKASISFA